MHFAADYLAPGGYSSGLAARRYRRLAILIGRVPDAYTDLRYWIGVAV
jgi:hypothetical protein